MEKLRWRYKLSIFKKYHWFEILLIVVIMSIHLYTAFSAASNFPSRWFTRDDAFYYFKVAQNISEGHGSTFDGINLTNGYHPLWMVICIPIFAFARFDLILPLRILMIVMAAISAGTSIFLYRLLKKPAGEIPAILAASYWAFTSSIHAVITQQGMETGILALTIVYFLSVLQQLEPKQELSIKDQVWLGLSALLVLFSRLDTIYLVGIAGIWLLFRRTPIRYLLPIDILMTFFIIVYACIDRASLKMYLLAYDTSAIIMAVLIIIFQTLFFYFTGLYTHPKNWKVTHLVVFILCSTTLTFIASTGVILLITKLTPLDLPRAVMFYYWLGMTLITLISRFSLRAITTRQFDIQKEKSPFTRSFFTSKIQQYLADIINLVKKGWIFGGLAGTGLLIYMVINRVIFGTFMPVSGQIKRWWGSMPDLVYGGPAKTVLDVFSFDPKYHRGWYFILNKIYKLAQILRPINKHLVMNKYWILLSLLGIIILGLFITNRKKNIRRYILAGIIPLGIGAFLHAFFYGALAYSSLQDWYWVPEMLTILIVFTIAIGELYDLIPGNRYKTFIGTLLASVYILSLIFGYAKELITRMPYKAQAEDKPYMDTLPILEGFTPKGAIIGMTGGGNTGYFIKDRTIINMDGLINSYQYFLAVKNNQGGKYLAERGLGYIFANPVIITSSIPYRNQFKKEELIPVKGAKLYGAKQLSIYKPK